MLKALCRRLFVVCAAWPLGLLWLGCTVRNREHLPLRGPAIIVGNHNSHLDTIVLLCLFPLRLIPRIRIAAAADYFYANPVSSFIAEWLFGLLPLDRSPTGRRDPLRPLVESLERGEIVILYPEGTRGDPERMRELKPGVWHLARRLPHVPVVPVYSYGMGRSLPKGEWIPVPFFTDLCIGEKLCFMPRKSDYMDGLRQRFLELRGQTLLGLRPDQPDDES